PADPQVMRRQPRPPQESVLGGGLIGAVAATGLLLAVTVLGVGVVAARAGWPWQTMVFLVLGLGQLGVALAVRARHARAAGPGLHARAAGPEGDRNWWLPAAVLLSAGLMVAAVAIPGLRGVLGTRALTLVQV